MTNKSFNMLLIVLEQELLSCPFKRGIKSTVLTDYYKLRRKRMSSFICERCGCIDNSAGDNNYWGVKMHSNSYKDDYANNHYLCTECTPQEFSDGSRNKKAGVWHNYFQKRHWSELGRDHIMEAFKQGCGNYTNAEEYFKELDMKFNRAPKHDITYCTNKECKQRPSCFRCLENYKDVDNKSEYSFCNISEEFCINGCKKGDQ